MRHSITAAQAGSRLNRCPCCGGGRPSRTPYDKWQNHLAARRELMPRLELLKQVGMKLRMDPRRVLSASHTWISQCCSLVRDGPLGHYFVD